MKIVQLDYSQLKSIVSSKGLLLQYKETSTQYELFAVELAISWEAVLEKGSDDATDFETNLKATANSPLEYRSTDGLPKVASAKFSDVKSFWVDGSATQADLSAGQTKYVKKHFSEAYTLSGVDAKWKDANWGDYIDFEVGFYTDESDETTFVSVNKFADHYMILDSGSRIFDVPTVRTIPSTVTTNGYTFNLYIRAKCVNAGLVPSKVVINLVGWK